MVEEYENDRHQLFIHMPLYTPRDKHAVVQCSRTGNRYVSSTGTLREI